MKFPNNVPLHHVEPEGTWVIEDVYMNVAITTSNFPELMPIGKTFKDELLEISDTTLKYVAGNGKFRTHSRA